MNLLILSSVNPNILQPDVVETFEMSNYKLNMIKTGK